MGSMLSVVDADPKQGLVTIHLTLPDLDEVESFGPFIRDCLRDVTEAGGWATVARSLVNSGTSSAFREDFDTYWIEAGQSIRAQVKDDRLLTRLLREALPPYAGEDLTLYRGENLRAYERCHVGFAWTPRIEVARGFASAVNVTPWGGVLLEGCFPRGAIISGPNAHSVHLDEHQFTVDPFSGTEVQVLEKYPRYIA